MSRVRPQLGPPPPPRHSALPGTAVLEGYQSLPSLVLCNSTVINTKFLRYLFGNREFGIKKMEKVLAS